MRNMERSGDRTQGLWSRKHTEYDHEGRVVAPGRYTHRRHRVSRSWETPARIRVHNSFRTRTRCDGLRR